MLALCFTGTRGANYSFYYLFIKLLKDKLQLPKVCNKKVPEITKSAHSTKFFMQLQRLENGRRTIQDPVTVPYVDRCNSLCREFKWKWQARCCHFWITLTFFIYLKKPYFFIPEFLTILMFCILWSYFVKVNAIRKSGMNDEEHLNSTLHHNEKCLCVCEVFLFSLWI